MNSELKNSPQLVNQSPFENGWMVKLKINDPKELESLMDESGYKKYASEAEKH